MNMRMWTLSAAVVFLTAPLPARDKVDVIVMQNGDRITGEIKGLESGVLTISVDYVDGNLSVQWSRIARIESPQLFIVKTQDGFTYTGTLTTAEPAGKPKAIRISETNQVEQVVEQAKVVTLEETSRSFLKRLTGAVGVGATYSKGNSTTQYNLSADIENRRERWGATAMYNSNLAASSGATTSTRNQVGLAVYHLMPWENYYYSGFAGFLQSSVQNINLQTTLGVGAGRYFKNTNRMRLSALVGLAWQTVDYKIAGFPDLRQQIFTSVVDAELSFFVFKKTRFTGTSRVAPYLSDRGRVYAEANLSYYLKLFGNLDWDLSFYGNWDTKPPDNLAGSDYGYSTGIKYTFGYR